MNMLCFRKYAFIGLGVLALGFSGFADEFGASEVKVDDSGVVVNLDEGEEITKLPTVYYDGDNPAALNNTTLYYNSNSDAGIDVSEDGSGNYVYTTTGSMENGTLNLSIDDAEMMALNYSPTFKQVLTQKMSAKGKRVSALGQALPSVGVSADSSWSQTRPFEYNAHNGRPDRPTLSERNTSQYSLVVSQPLFKGGSIISAIRASRIYSEWVSEDIKTSRQAIIRTIRTQYYTTLYHQKLVEIYQEQAQISKEYWEKTKRRYEADDVAEIEVLKYEVQYKIAEARYIQAKSDYDVYRVNILRLIGAPLDTELTLTTPLDFAEINPGNEQELTAQALATRPELKESKLSEDIQKENIKQAKSALYPEISAVASWGQSNRWSSSSTQGGWDQRGTDWSWKAGFQLSWNVLAGGGQLVRGQIIQAKAILDSYEFATEDTTDMIKEEVKASLLTLFSSIDWVKSQQENVAQAQRVLQQETIKWDEGAGDYLDILDARNTLASTQQLYWQGVATYNVSVVTLEYSIGKYQNETNTVVKGYNVVRNKPKKIRKRKKFTHQNAEDSLKALAVPADLDVSEEEPVKSAPQKDLKNSYNMNVPPARIDRNVKSDRKISEASSPVPAQVEAGGNDVAEPKLFF